MTFAATAQATLIYSNLGSTTAGSDPLSVQGPPLFDSFSSSAFALADVKLLLSGTPDAASFAVALYNDNSISPGTLLTTIGSLGDSVLSSTLTVVDFPPASPYVLAAGRY